MNFYKLTVKIKTNNVRKQNPYRARYDYKLIVNKEGDRCKRQEGNKPTACGVLHIKSLGYGPMHITWAVLSTDITMAIQHSTPANRPH